eukprot:CAMPEP_0180213232 /NCGR_PEP_ID=MMETSP0987-20121128/14042_1 /TAXON_ID=697907 /ORGANISM="non described non described, Strain CCMP2293" /LENGTH=75 /DNA_ID=CAMNT_0022171189 /DNA_START=299 /DNA_END=523 /DNA_ORIENTATION=-
MKLSWCDSLSRSALRLARFSHMLQPRFGPPLRAGGPWATEQGPYPSRVALALEGVAREGGPRPIGPEAGLSVPRR